MTFLYVILGILLFLFLLISAVLSLPIKIIITYSDDCGFDYKIKILFYTLKSDPKKHTFLDVLKQLKEIQEKDLSEIDTKKTKAKSVSKYGILSTVSEVFALLKFVLGYLRDLLGVLRVSRLNLDIVCADDEDTAEAATDYGKTCAVVYPVLGFIHSSFKVKKRKERINISCDYMAEKPSFSLDTVLSIRIFHIFVALLPTLKKLIKQTIAKAKNAQNSIEKRG